MFNKYIKQIRKVNNINDNEPLTNISRNGNNGYTVGTATPIKIHPGEYIQLAANLNRLALEAKEAEIVELKKQIAELKNTQLVEDPLRHY